MFLRKYELIFLTDLAKKNGKSQKGGGRVFGPFFGPSPRHNNYVTMSTNRDGIRFRNITSKTRILKTSTKLTPIHLKLCTHSSFIINH